MTDSSGTDHYATEISSLSDDTFDLSVYRQISGTSSPLCPTCLLFRVTLESHGISLTDESTTFLIKRHDSTHSTLYILLECPVAMILSIAFPSLDIQYFIINQSNHSSPPNDINDHSELEPDQSVECVVQSHSTDTTSDSIHYIMYSTNLSKQQWSDLTLYQFHIPMALQQTQQRIPIEHSISSNLTSPHFVYHDNMLYIIDLGMSSLYISRYDIALGIWNKNVSHSIFSNLSIDRTTTIYHVGIHRTVSHRLKLDIFLNHNGSKMEIISWLIDSDLYSVHEYIPNQSIMINDFGTNLILKNTEINEMDKLDELRKVPYFDDINHFLHNLPLSEHYKMRVFEHRLSLHRNHRTLLEDPCQDSSTTCQLLKDDCDDEGLQNLCQQTCGRCEKRMVSLSLNILFRN